MLLWPTITALGFVALIAVVIALGTRSTARYEAEKAAVAPRTRAAATDAVRATATATAVL